MPFSLIGQPGTRPPDFSVGWPRRLAIATCTTALLSLSACTTPGQVTCPDQSPATDIRIDASKTSRSENIRSGRQASVHSQLELTALCHGTIRVGLFSSGTGATTTLFEDRLEAEGATMPARQRKLEEVVNPTKEHIARIWDEGEASLPADGTDVLGQLELMAEYFAQHPNHAHRGFILSDGVQTAGGLTTNDETFNDEVAADLAERVAVPDLTGAEITIAGIGRMAGEPPPSSYVAALKTFYRRVCERTRAQCLVVTDLAAHGGAS